jgi:phage-related protein (TIGR01555 family)
MTGKNSSEADSELTIFSDNLDRSFEGSIFEDALFSSLTTKEREQIEKNKKAAIAGKDFQDAVNNQSQALGGGTNDLTYKGLSFFSRRSLSWQITKQDSIMRGIPYFDKGSSWKATRALINGIDLNSRTFDSDELNDIKNSIQSLFAPLHKVIKLGDFNGASAGLLVFDDCVDEADYATPLKVSNIKKGTFKGIKPLTRYYQIIPALDDELVDKVGEDIGIYSANEIGQPKYYRVNISGDREAKYKFFRVHRSRVLWYASIELTWIEQRVELYGGPSLLERTYTDFARYESLVAQVNKLAQRSNIPILNMKGLPQASLNSTNFVNRVMAKIKSMNFSVSSGNMLVLGDAEKEKFKFETANMAGLIDVLKHERQNLSASIEAPTSVLFNEPDDNDEDIYLTKIKEIQEGKLRDWYTLLIQIQSKNIFGKRIKDFSFIFKSLEFVSQKDQAERLKILGEILHQLYEDEVIDTLSYQAMLTVAMENVSDMPHEITKEYIEYLQKEAKVNPDNPLTKNRRQIELAIALNHANMDNAENGGGTSKPVESAIKGETEGGNKEKKKPAPKVPITTKEKGDK